MELYDQLEPGGEQVHVTTVAGAVLSSFFDELARLDDFGECAEQLRKLVLVDGVFAEPAFASEYLPGAPANTDSTPGSGSKTGRHGVQRRICAERVGARVAHSRGPQSRLLERRRDSEMLADK